MPGPQTDAIECPFEDLFYGGARFGGKSQFLLGDFAARAQLYGSRLRGVLFRRTYDELTDLIEESRKIYGRLGWSYNETAHIWRSPNGATLFLRYLDKDVDAEHYKGWNLQWLGFDEMDQWPDPRPIDKLWATLRSTEGVPAVRRCTGNPGGPGHSWIKKRYRPHLWKPGAKYVVTRYQPQPVEAPELWIDAVFIPARLEDNVLVDRAEYEARVAAATAGSAQLYRAWRYGDWDVLAGTYFDIFDERRHVTTRGLAGIQPWHPHWLSMDWGFTDDSAIHWHSANEEKRIVTYAELVTNKKTPDVLGHMIADASQIGVDEERKPVYQKLEAFYLSPDAFGEKQSQRTIADEMGDVLASLKLPRPTKAVAGPHSRVPGWQLMYQLLQSDYWKMTTDCPELIETLPLLQRDDDYPEDIADHPRDHAADSARYGLTTYLRDVKEPVAIAAARMVTSTDPTIRAMQSARAEQMIERASRPMRFRRKRLF